MVDPGIGHTKIHERTQGSGAAKSNKKGRQVRILSTSDLHGDEDQYRMLKKEAQRNQADVVIIFE
jgi:hypothetical protein